MYAIAVVSETVNDRAFVSMAEDVWCLPFLIALRALPDQPNPWIFYVSLSLSFVVLFELTATTGLGNRAAHLS
jgi:hypothetical protein